MSIKRYYGKYRGFVANNIDLEGRARIQATVPAVSSLLPTTWCEPCLPVAGKGMGAYFVPQIGAGVWIEFEQGDPRRPIWTGCRWGNVAEVPLLVKAGVPATPSIVLQTATQNTLMISDVPGPTGGILLQIGPTPGVASVSVSATGIIMKSGTSTMVSITPAGITLTSAASSVTIGPGKLVTLNQDGLIVT
jgi:Type VI secretion system/phage-baseplate injector OB domain